MNIHLIFAPESIRIAGIELIDVPAFLEFLFRFALNTTVILILVRYLYYATTRRKDYLFTYILIASVVFLLCFLLESVKLQIGFALGLFAIFGIIRYRTDSIPIKEMTYLFLVIGISVINALTSDNTSVADLIFTNIVLIGITYGLERVWLMKHESSKIITYEKIALIKPDKYDELLADLKERTGIHGIKRAEIGKIDFLRDTCTITVFYDAEGNNLPMQDEEERKDDGDDD
nr:DUF4956 domain-containing protein [Bacteroidales bacterium]